LGAVRHSSRHDGAQAVVHSILIVAVTLLVPTRFRLRRVREVEPEVIPPEDRPFVVQLLSVGQLPGGETEPAAKAVDSEIEVAVEELDEEPAQDPIPTQEEPAAPPGPVGVQRRSTRAHVLEPIESAPEPPPEARCEIRFWRGYLKANFYAR